VDIRTAPRDSCSVAAALQVVGERWTFLVLREAFLGVRRFEDFRRNTGAARNILSDRLNRLVANGILRRERYSDHPPRYEYRLTEKGLDLNPILVTLSAWGDKHGGNAEPLFALEHRDCGHRITPVLTCPDCGEPVDDAHTLRLVLANPPAQGEAV